MLNVNLTSRRPRDGLVEPATLVRRVVYGRFVTSEYRAAVGTAAEVLGTGLQRMRAAEALLAQERLPVELAAALVAAHDQLDAALRRLGAALDDAGFYSPPGPRDHLDGRCDARGR